MIRFLRLLIIALVALILVVFTFANREWVTVSLDPFASSEDAALAMRAPLFVVVIAFAALGVLAGAAATWVSQGRHRRAARVHRAEADKWRAEAQALRTNPGSPARALPGA
jgi:uncharacterized integral membrane protein